VLAAIQEANLRGQIAVTYKLITIATDVLSTLRKQANIGVISESELFTQEAALAQIEQTLPPLQTQ
jgi:outer membrane protein TolC